MPQFDVSTFASQIFWLAVTFALVYAFCGRWVLPRLGQMIEARTARIEKHLDESQTLNDQAKLLSQASEERRATAHEKARKIIEKGRADMAAWSSAQRAEMEARLATSLQASQAQIRAAKQKAIEELKADLPDMLAGVMGKVDPGNLIARDGASIRRALKDAEQREA